MILPVKNVLETFSLPCIRTAICDVTYIVIMFSIAMFIFGDVTMLAILYVFFILTRLYLSVTT